MNAQIDERGRHRAGCKCGFCQNMGSFGKKKDDNKAKDDDEKEPTNEAKWIKRAINPKHKGYCTPMTKATCTPRRKALARRFKSGDLSDSRVEQIVAELLEDEE